MPPKKTGKNKKAPDTRGYSTVSVPSQWSLAQAAMVAEDAPAPIAPVELAPIAEAALKSFEETAEIRAGAERKKRVASEVAYLQKCKAQGAYRGRLYPPLTTDIQLNFSMPTKSLLDAVLTYTSGPWPVPLDWRCWAWNYDRVARNLHALESTSLDLAVCAEAIAAAKGCDERAAFECAVAASVPSVLPAGWCEFFIASSTGQKSCIDTDSDKSIEEDAMRRARAREVEMGRLQALQRAKQLVNEIERIEEDIVEEDELPSPLSPTSRYAALKQIQASLINAISFLEKREKRLLEGRLLEVRKEMAALGPEVDFRRLAGKIETSVEGDSKSNTFSELEALQDPDGGDPTAEDEPMFALLEAAEEMASTSTCSESQVFEYVLSENKAYKTPTQLLNDAIKETKHFHFAQEGPNKWIEVGELGPLSAAAAKRLGRPKAGFVTSTPDLPSRDPASARQLACLKLLFDIKPSSEQRGVASLLAPCVSKIWDMWIKAALSASEREQLLAAEERVCIIERCLQDYDSTESFADCWSAPSAEKVGNYESGNEHRRSGLSRRSVGEELAVRERNGRFPLEYIRAQLPALRHGRHLVDTISSNEITIVAGDTGSGKSTQVPQLLLRSCSEDGDQGTINIIVTEPRRVAAISVSDRVRVELGDADRDCALCGYTVRLDSNVGPKCVIEYVTIGVLLRRIQMTKGRCLSQYSHCIVDEVHERSVDSDLLLLLLRQYKIGFNNHAGSCFPKIVLMSATADIETISSYWRAASESIGFASIEGRAFPVDVFFLEDVLEIVQYSPGWMQADLDTENQFAIVPDLDALSKYDLSSCSERTQNVLMQLDATAINYDIIMSALKYALSDDGAGGAVIVFMPGLEEIKKVISAIEADGDLLQRCVPVAMHSSLSVEDLQRAFKKVEHRKRKVVVSTNICETGVTIEDVDLVIDTGFVKSVEWNEVTETSRLRMHMCSIAEATQRRGRAGRVRPGRCMHLFSKKKMSPEFEGENGRLKLRPEPEMRRAPLTAPILSLTDQGLGPSTLLKAPGETVTIAKLTNAVQTLLELGALVDSGELIDETTSENLTRRDPDDRSVLSRLYKATPLGRALAALPCDPRSGKVLLAAHMLGCLSAASVFIASLDTKSVFNRNLQSEQFFKAQFGKRTESDAVMIVNAYSEWMLASSKYQWCRQHSVSMPAITQVAGLAKDLIRAVLSVCEDRDMSELQQLDDSARSDKRSRVGDSNFGYNTCVTCKTQVGMHSCIVLGSREALHAAITTGMGNNVSFCSSPTDDKAPRFLCGNKSNVQCRIHKTSFVTNPGQYVVYCNQMISQSGSQSLLNVISIDAITMILFSPWSKVFLGEGAVIIGRGIGVRIRPATLVALRRLRADWESALVGNTRTCASGKRIDELRHILFKLVSYNRVYY